MDEVWRPIARMDGAYEVSNLGRVRRSKPGKRTRVGLVLRPNRSKDGYQIYTLRYQGKEITSAAHIYVADAFLGQGAPGLQVNHKDGNKDNNCVDNLERVTAEENRRHAVRTGLTGRGERARTARLTESSVRQIRALLRDGESTRSVARKFGMSQSAVMAIKKRLAWKHVA